tara:strand:+ start:8506 stop:10548 length:2043 start_codon:yes stop_codon:yes gene_type:complete
VLPRASPTEDKAKTTKISKDLETTKDHLRFHSWARVDGVSYAGGGPPSGMGRNRRKKKGKGLVSSNANADSTESRLEEPLLGSEDDDIDVENPTTSPGEASYSGSNHPIRPQKRSPARSPRTTPTTPPMKTPNRLSPMSIPKPRVVTPNAKEQAPNSPQTLTEPLLPISDSADVRVTFRGDVPEGDSDEDSDDDNDDDDDSPVFSNSKELSAIWSLGWPMGVSYFCRMAMASTDSIMVGHYSGGNNSPGEYLAASALSDMLTTLMVVPPLAFNQVLNALVGQAVGSGRKEMAGVWLQQSVFWLGATMLPFLSGFFFVERILLALGFSDTISALAGKYARYNIFWPVPNGWYQCMRFYFQAVGKPRPAMWNSVFFLFVNALLNAIFVFGLPFRYYEIFNHWKGLGFIGAAVSLSCSRCLQPLVYWVYMFLMKKAHADFWPEGGWGIKSLRKHHTYAVTKEFLKQGVPLVGTLVFSATVSQATTLLVSKLGTDAVAATTAVSTATVMWAGAINAMFSMVIAVRVGYHLGRGDGDAARKSFWLATGVVSVVLLTVVSVTLPFTEEVVGLTTSDKVVVKNGARVLPAALLATLLGVLNSLCTGGVFSGQGRQSLVAGLSFFVDIPLSIGGVAAIVLLVKHATLLNVYEYQMAAALLELLLAYAFIVASDWNKYAREAKERQARR